MHARQHWLSSILSQSDVLSSTKCIAVFILLLRTSVFGIRYAYIPNIYIISKFASISGSRAEVDTRTQDNHARMIPFSLSVNILWGLFDSLGLE